MSNQNMFTIRPAEQLMKDYSGLLPSIICRLLIAVCSDMKKETEQPSIQAFFAGRSVFVTGASGFIGKVLIEKLLRSCPDIAEIFLLLRPKKGIGSDVRLKKMLENKLFDKLRTEQPSSFKKLVPIVGDAAVVGLGLLPADRQRLIDRVSVIFHIAASVRFDDDLRHAIFMNTRSTRDVCILASSMKKLVVLLHVSSTYTQIDKYVVDEIVYPTNINWRRAIEIAESVDEHTLKILTSKYIGAMPNTYVFTKRLAEQVISDYSESLPSVLLRPSIVVQTMEEPLKGWLDNFNGPIGTLIGGGKGIMRVLYSDPAVTNDYVPADFVIKMIIIAVWRRGLRTISEDKTIHVYNCSSNNWKKITIMETYRIGYTILKEIPLERAIWYPHTMLIKNCWMFYILMLLLHVIPAICIDGIIKLFGARPMLLKLQRKVYVTNINLSHFLLNEWIFNNTQCFNLMNGLSDENKKDFASNYMDLNLREYYKNGLIGSKIYLLNEDMNNLKAAKLHCKRIYWLHNIVKTMFIIFILWILYCKIVPSNSAKVFFK